MLPLLLLPPLPLLLIVPCRTGPPLHFVHGVSSFAYNVLVLSISNLLSTLNSPSGASSPVRFGTVWSHSTMCCSPHSNSESSWLESTTPTLAGWSSSSTAFSSSRSICTFLRDAKLPLSITTLTRLFLLRARSRIRVSIELAVASRYTYTSRICPIRWHRACACASTCGFQSLRQRRQSADALQSSCHTAAVLVVKHHDIGTGEVDAETTGASADQEHERIWLVVET